MIKSVTRKGIEKALTQASVRRFEFKYVVRPEVLSDLQRDLSSFLPHDPYSDVATDKFYPIHTLYLDTPALTHFFEKDEGLEEKTKYRLRCYSIQPTPEMPVYAEIKHKHNLKVSKKRITAPFAATEEFCRQSRWGFYDTMPSWNGSEGAAWKNFFWAAQRRHLKPAALVIYERQAWQSPDRVGYLRITVDRSIRACITDSLLPLASQKTKMVSDAMVLELKFDLTVPYWVYALLRKYGLERQAYSKYHLAGEVLSIEDSGAKTFLKEDAWTGLRML